MHRSVSVLSICLVLSLIASPLASQSTKIPKISGRSFTSGSAKVTVTGSFQIDQEVAISDKASFGDGEMTWLQFGASGSDQPNMTITVSLDEIGVIVGKGKYVATGGVPDGGCKGTMEVTATTVTGHYTCPGITAHNPNVPGLGKVNIEVRFSTKS